MALVERNDNARVGDTSNMRRKRERAAFAKGGVLNVMGRAQLNRSNDVSMGLGKGASEQRQAEMS